MQKLYRNLPAGFVSPCFTQLWVLSRNITRSGRAASPTNMPALVKPSFLDENKDAIILDATWSVPKASPTNPEDPNPYQQYLSDHIPGACFFDLDRPEHTSASPLPHMLPSAAAFTQPARALGLRNDLPVIVYSRSPFVAAARVWWMLRAFGKEDVFVLDGGLDSWRLEGRPVVEGEVHPKQGDFTPVLDHSWVRDMSQILAIIEQGGVILDARSKGRFEATAPEPRPGLMGGHMPGAISLPASAVIDPNGLLRTGDDLRDVLSQHGITDAQLQGEVALSCGTGVTASVLCLALHEIGVKSAVYDGSWSEYGSHRNNPFQTTSASS